MTEEQRARNRKNSISYYYRNREVCIARSKAARVGEDPVVRHARLVKLRATAKKSPEANRRSAKRWYQKIRGEMFDALGRACACCGESEQAFLTLDHVNNDGAEHRRLLSKTGNPAVIAVYTDARRQGFPIDRFQILCMNCNWAKRRTGTCPHQTMKGAVNG